MDDISIIRTPEELSKDINCLNKLFEMRDLGKAKSLLSENSKNEILYTKKLIKAKVINVFICTNLICYLSQ